MEPIETIEGLLEHARQKNEHVKLVLGGRVDAPVDAMVRARNGSTFEFVISGAVVRIDVAHVILLVT